MSSPHPSSSSWEPPLPEELQRSLPQYEIIGILGRGGMGAVYKARQASLGRDIAIKILPGTLKGEDDPMNLGARFLQEARAMAKLSHPAIISIYGFGETLEGHRYFVMEFVDGLDIQRYIQHHGGKLSVENALAITAHVLDALDYAHGQGIMHRDIKPANILLTQEGRVKIADFGLAKRFGGGVDPGATALTMTNMVVGTPDYLAPEALDGDQSPDHRADLYAVGVMLYRMLTGKLPRGILKLPSELDAAIDPHIDAIVARAMEPNPEERYANAALMRSDLNTVLSRPLPKVEAGKPSGVVDAAVPATSAVLAKRPVYSKMVSARQGASKPGGRSWDGLGKISIVLGGMATLLLAGFTFAILKPQKDQQIEKSPALPPLQFLELPATKLNPELALASLGEPYENSLGMKFVPVPGTDVLFCIHEVRWIDYFAWADKNPAVNASWRSQNNGDDPGNERMEDHPVVGVDWYEARAFCRWLSHKEGLTYRLPSDREWSIAVGLGEIERPGLDDTPESVAKDEIQYPWGTGWPPPPGAGNYSDKSRREHALSEVSKHLPDYDDGFPTTAPVMSFSPNPFGLHDMGGNVSEWCEEHYGTAPDERIVRGASWNHNGEKTLLSSPRVPLHPLRKGYDTGFRVVVELTVAKPPPPASALESAEAKARLTVVTQKKPFENTLGMTFVPIPGTEVLFCHHETRWKDYAEFAEGNPEVAPLWRPQSANGFRPTERHDEHPVIYVTWNDAKAFCEWLSRKEGLDYRLPTDREWSIAVGIGDSETWDETTTPETVSKSSSMFPWGTEQFPPPGAGNLSDESRRAKAPREGALYLDDYDDGFPTTAPVMSFPPNTLGIFDLGSNVREWCEDWYSVDKELRTVRDVSWANATLRYMLSSTRSRFEPASVVLSDLGFRVVIELPTTDSEPTKAAATTTESTEETAPADSPGTKSPNPPPQANASLAPSLSTSSAQDAVSLPARVSTRSEDQIPSLYDPPEGDAPSGPAIRQATKDAPLENTLGMKFVTVPGTEVLFCIHETRWQDFAAYAAENPSIDASWKKQHLSSFRMSELRQAHPVVYVSWEDAKAFCAWLSSKESKNYRLPTDQEWSIATGIGATETWDANTTPATVSRSSDAYPWGRDWPPPKGAGNYSDESRQDGTVRPNVNYIDGYNDGFPTTAPVMQFNANGLGIFDMGGNVYEYCEDWYSSEKKQRVVRGGSWFVGLPSELLSSRRSSVQASNRAVTYGFRIVLVPDPVYKPDPGLISITGLAPRLDSYLKARNTQLGELASNYRRAIQVHFDQAADAGSLHEVEFYKEELNRIDLYVAELGQSPDGPIASALHRPVMSALTGATPKQLVALRQTWSSESARIERSLLDAFQQSLSKLETELTQAKELDQVQQVQSYQSAQFRMLEEINEGPGR